MIIWHKLFILNMFCAISFLAHAQTRVLYEDFSSAGGSTPPKGWTYKIVNGNALYDSFFYENPTCFFAPGIDGHFAFFDVYNGGIQGSSNGDGYAENVLLITPVIDLDTSREWTLAFDYHFMRLRAPGFAVLWRPDASTPWAKVWEDNYGTNLTAHAEILVMPGSVVKGKGQFAFNWITTNNALTQGYLALDNVQVFSRNVKDVSINTLFLNRPVICKKDTARAVFTIRNPGTSDITMIPLRLKVKYPLADTSFRDTIWSLKKGQSVPYSLENKFAFRSGYTYDIEAISVLNEDTTRWNDTARFRLTWLDTIQRPVVMDGERCGSGTVSLYALTHLNDTTFWFSNNGQLLGKGASFTTPVISRTDTFLARSVKLFPGSVNTWQGPYRFSTPSSGGAYVQVIAQEHLVIHSLAQHFAASGTFEAEVYYKKGSYSGYENDSVAWTRIASEEKESGGWGEFTGIPVAPVELFKGDTASFFLAIKGKATPTFKRTALRIAQPSMVVVSDRVTNKRFVSGGTLYSDLSWDGEVRFWTTCMSEADTVSVRVISRPDGVKVAPGVSFNGLFRAGTLKNPDQVSEQGQAAYDIFGPTGMSNADYGKTWNISNLKVTTTGGWNIPDSLYYVVPPLFSSDYQLVLKPRGFLIDSTVHFRFTVFNFKNGCDTTIERFVHISLLPDPRFAFREVCEGMETVFENLTSTIRDAGLTFHWNFGDGTSASGYNQLKVYANPGKYQVKLTATNSSGIKASLVREVVVYERPRPQIDAQFACEGDPVRLEAKRITPDQKLTWLIDSIAIKDLVVVNHIYTEAGSHMVKLIAANEGCSDTATRNVFQFHRPVADITADGRCSYDTFSLTSSVMYSGPGNLGYKWLVNGNLLSTIPAWKGIMPKKGTNTVTLIVSSQFQCTDTIGKQVIVMPSPRADFDVGLACFDVETKFFNKSKDTAGLNVQYQWSFGDGRFSTEVNPVNNYQNAGEVMVALRVTANNGCSNRKDSLVVVKVKPNAKFTYSGACDGQGVVFTNYSEQSDGPLRYEWDFGDGFTSSLHSPVHAYRVNKPTTFLVSLRVSADDQSCADIRTEPVTIAPMPDCDFKAIQSVTDRTVWRFEPMQIDSQNHDYTWIFVGSGASTNAAPVHRFEYTETNYRVIIRIVNSEGCECIDSTNYIQTSWTTGIHSPVSEDLRVFPNPASDQLFVEFQSEKRRQPNRLIMMDVTGREVLSEEWVGKFATLSLDLVSLKEGTYFLICESIDGYYVTVPVVIAR